MKRLLANITVVASLAIAMCPQAHALTPSGRFIDETPPMFLLASNNGMRQMVYWCDTAEPVRNEDNEEFFDIEHQEWALQEALRRNASQYTKLIVNYTQTRDVKYVDEILLDPDGEKLFTGELHNSDLIPSPGARFALVGGQPLNEDDPSIVVVTGSYLATHKPMEIKPVSDGELLPLPPTVIKKLEDTYGMKVERSILSYKIGDRYLCGALQFQGEYKKPGVTLDHQLALALEVFIDNDNDNIYAYPVEGWYLPDEGPTWNAEDGGEYYPSIIVAAFEGPQGPECCFIHWAPESATTGMFLLRNNKVECEKYTVYHTLYDEELPVWKKDIEEMKRLYVADDPYENEDVELTKWAHVYIDYDSEQIWISDEAEENGALFNREDGKLRLITTVRSNFRPSFPQDKGDNHYLILSGPAGGPSYYTEIFKLRGGKVVEEFNAIQVYGEIDGCVLNGKEIPAAQGKAYIEDVPEANEPFIFWHEIENK